MKQVLFGGTYDLLHIETTEYNSLTGSWSWASTVDVKAQVISTPGTLKNLRVKLNDVPGTGTYTFTLHRAVGTGAWANTILTCTVAADGTTASDTSNEVAVAAGDVVCLECNPDAPDNARYATWTMLFEGDTANESLLLLSIPLSTTDTRYAPLMGFTYDAVENNARCVCPTSGTIKNLYVQLSHDPGDDPDAHKFTLRIAGVSKLLTVTITTADDRTGNDTTNEVAVSAGDVLTIMTEPLNAPSGSGYAGIGMTFVADTDGESLILSGSSDDLDNTNTEYMYLIFNRYIGWSATEAERYQLGQECTLKKLYVLLSAAPGDGKSYTFNLRKPGNGQADGNLTVTITGAATVTGNDLVNTDAIANDDYVDLKCVPAGTPDAADAYWGLVGYIAPPAVEKKHTFRLDPRPRTRMSFHPNLKLG